MHESAWEHGKTRESERSRRGSTRESKKMETEQETQQDEEQEESKRGIRREIRSGSRRRESRRGPVEEAREGAGGTWRKGSKPSIGTIESGRLLAARSVGSLEEELEGASSGSSQTP